jgi:hypothetical protein
MVAAPGVAAHGVVAGEPHEELATAGELVGPACGVLEDLAFEDGVERLGEGVVGRAEHYDRARGNLDRHAVHFLIAYVAGV